MNKVSTFFREFYSYHKKDFWILNALSISAAAIFSLFPLDELVQAGIIFFLLMKCFSFLRNSSIMPSISSDFDRYSWKYLQSLPFSKKELLISLVLTNLFVTSPLLVWLISFIDQIATLIAGEEQSIAWPTQVKIIFAVLSINILISCQSIFHIIIYPRRQYSRNDPKIIFYSKIKKLLLVLTVFIYGSLFLFLIHHFSGINIPILVLKNLQPVYDKLSFGYLIPILYLLGYLAFSKTLRTWRDEKIGYIHIEWSNKKDFSVMALLVVMLYVPASFLYFADAEYKGSALLKSIHEKNYEEISLLLQNGEDLNQSNEYGYTPLLLAAQEGDFKMYQFLEKQGASPKGVLKNGMNVFLLAVDGENIHLVKHLMANGYRSDKVATNSHHPLHIAAAKCNTEIIDLLLENGGNPNTQNHKGQTPLHIVASRKCFGPVASLLEGGADPNIQDARGKMAFEYVTGNQNKELAYYLKKRTRDPAGK